MIIGITGGSGSGKTTLLETARSLGFRVLDCDRIYHDLLASDRALLEAIEGRFPGTVENGSLQRKKLGAVVFADADALADLNAITHTAVKQAVLAQLIPGENVAIDAIALFESGLADHCDVTVAVTADADLRVSRLMERDGITEAYARSRLAAQHRDDWYEKRCDYLLENNADALSFQHKCLAFFRQMGIMK